MLEQSNYWTGRTITRRAALQGAALGGGIAALGLAACGGRPSPQPSANGGSGGTGSGAKPTTVKTVLDPTKGKQGGNFVIQQFADPGGGLELIKIRNAGVHQMASFTLEGLVEFWNGTPAHDGYDIRVQPNLAQAMPEQPDPQTYVFKLRPAKFHTGRAVTSEDVKWSYETYAHAPESAWKTDVSWIDHVDTPDAQTAVVKSTFPYADALQSMAARYCLEILAREFQESPEAQKKLVGTGPYLFVDYQPPVVSHFKRNPDYHRPPYPYFDTIELLGTSDSAKHVADFIAKKVDMTYQFPPDERDEIKKARPDAQFWTYTLGSSSLYMRTDKPPFNDKRVRQAMSMAVDRKALRDAISKGEGHADQIMSVANGYWGFRKPSELGAAAKYWNLDPKAAKQLMEAAGVSPPLKFDLPHWNATVVGQVFVDNITLVEAQWRSAGLTDTKDLELTFGQGIALSIGNYDLAYWGPDGVGYYPEIGLPLKNGFYWPPEGIKGPPTLNVGYINDAQLNTLVVKQLGQFQKEERMQTFRQIEDLLAEEQYRTKGNTSVLTYFGNPRVKNMQVARDAYNGAIPYVKYWWFA